MLTGPRGAAVELIVMVSTGARGAAGAGCGRAATACLTTGRDSGKGWGAAIRLTTDTLMIKNL